MEFDQLPGFRFHPTDEELLDFYLTNTVLGKEIHVDIIGFLNIYNHEPWDLPGLARIGEREWYFFVHRESKNGHGGRRTSRTTEDGYWKATGSDRPISCSAYPKRLLGHRKTMVFYRGRAPRGCKTDWVMNEYRLPSNLSLPKEIVLCKVYRKATSLKVLEQRAAIEEETARVPHHLITSSYPLVTQETDPSFYDQRRSFINNDFFQQNNINVHKVEELAAIEEEDNKTAQYSSQIIGSVGPIKDYLSHIQLPKFILDWSMDPLWA